MQKVSFLAKSAVCLTKEVILGTLDILGILGILGGILGILGSILCILGILGILWWTVSKNTFRQLWKINTNSPKDDLLNLYYLYVPNQVSLLII